MTTASNPTNTPLLEEQTKLLHDFFGERKERPWTTNVGSPEHYNNNWSIGEFIYKNKLGFFEGNIIKYVCRYDKKGGIEDLRKAQDYLNKLISLENQKDAGVV